MALIKIDLTEQLGDGQYVDMRDPKFLSWGMQKKLQSSLKDQSMDSQLQFAEDLAVQLIVSGNIVDENAVLIPFPLTPESLERIPAVVIESVASKFAEIKSKGATLEKK